MSPTVRIALVVAVIALAIALLLGGCSDSKKARIATPTTPSGVSKPISLPLESDPDALLLGRHEKDILAGIAARPGGPVEIAVLRGETPIPTGQLAIRIDGRPVEGQSCGPTCSRVRAPVLAGAPTRLSVQALTTTFTFELPARPPPSGKAVFARAKTTMGRLRSFRFSERLTSGHGSVLSDYDIQAPNRIELRTKGFRSVIIGKTRWDYRAGRWERGAFPGLNVSEMLMWHSATHPRIVGRGPGGRTELTAFAVDPVPSWFRLTVAPSGRVLDAEMTAASHFMLHRYRDFNGAISIKPPVRQ